MKKVLFILPSYSIGGINTSLINLLSALKDSDLDINIYVCNPSGALQNRYKNYKIIPQSNLYSLLLPFSKEDNLFWKIFKVSFRIILKLCRSIQIDLVPVIYKLVANKLSKGNYKAVIALQEGPVTQFSSYFKSEVLVAWIHCMYERYLDEIGSKSEENIYSRFDRVVTVSQAASGSFYKCYPQFKDKIVCINNCLDNEAIREMANEISGITSDFKTDIFTIITLGRIDRVKQFSSIPEIAQKLHNANFKFRWYILGSIADSEEYKLIIDRIQQFNVEENVFLLGATVNPYPYIAKSDLLVCTSKSESFNYTLSEAKVLHIPVVTTDFNGAAEFVQEGTNGFISSLDRIHLPIGNLISNVILYNKIKKNVNVFEYMNKPIIEAFIKLIEGI